MVTALAECKSFEAYRYSTRSPTGEQRVYSVYGRAMLVRKQVLGCGGGGGGALAQTRMVEMVSRGGKHVVLCLFYEYQFIFITWYGYTQYVCCFSRLLVVVVRWYTAYFAVVIASA